MITRHYDWDAPGALLRGLLALDEQIRAYIEYAFARAGVDLTLRRLHLLQLVADLEAGRPSDLATRMGIAKRSMTDAIKLLADARYVQVLDDPADQRASVVVITPEGRKALDSASSALGQVQTELFATLRKPRHHRLETTLFFLSARMREIDKRYPGKVRRRVQPTR